MAAAITPAMSWYEQRSLLLDIQASLQWLGGIRALKRRVRTELIELGIDAHVAIAISAPGAWLLTMHMQRQMTPPTWRYGLSARRLMQRLDALPIGLLTGAKPYQVWLQRLGCYALGQVRALDRNELATRTHPDLLLALDQAYGQAPFTYHPVKLPPQFYERISLPRLIEHVTALQWHLQRLLTQLCQWLKQKHLAITELECRLHHRDRRRAWQPTVLMLAIAEPSDDIDVLWRWLQTRLERIDLPAPVSDISLVSRTLLIRNQHNLSLFVDEHTSNQSVLKTLDLLRARLGQAQVQQASIRADYRPEAANNWQPSNDPVTSLPGVLDWGAHCPAWLLSAPKALKIRHDQPQLNGPLHLLQGPYRIETGWWDHSFAMRDYFVASDQSARRYWIYRERDNVAARWFLHGLFG
jgi:protein ImuB